MVMTELFLTYRFHLNNYDVTEALQAFSLQQKAVIKS